MRVSCVVALLHTYVFFLGILFVNASENGEWMMIKPAFHESPILYSAV